MLTELHQFAAAESRAFLIESNDCLFTVSAIKIHYLEIPRLHLLNRNYCHKGATLITMHLPHEKASTVISPCCIILLFYLLLF